ncbi:hypothetical protein E2C01_087833 [Portunus trituberculatus]|uniref:Uncharacterized protein n=1 Tax=Portunus trituberculatus TaxID=210409 RepID=A0A5B7JHJ8_PORTR|nr:hypothetical protein [Portunus trituberculatus]
MFTLVSEAAPPYSCPMGLRCPGMSQRDLATTMGHHTHALPLSHCLRDNARAITQVTTILLVTTFSCVTVKRMFKD